MKFTNLACLLGATQAMTIWTTDGQVAYMEKDEDDATNI